MGAATGKGRRLTINYLYDVVHGCKNQTFIYHVYLREGSAHFPNVRPGYGGVHPDKIRLRTSSKREQQLACYGRGAMRAFYWEALRPCCHWRDAREYF
jgi:hypothetical protein